MMMRHDRQFTIVTALVVTALVAVLLQLWSKSWLTIVIIDVVVAVSSIELLKRNLPNAIQKSLVANCKRANGSWSSRRARAEAKAVRKLQLDLLLVLSLVLLSMNAIVWFVDTEVVPLSVGWNAVGSFQLSEQAWKDNLRDEEEQFDLWGERNRLSPSDLRDRKQMLWHYWPAVVAVGLGWIAVAFAIIKGAYFLSLKELSDSIQHRTQQYKMLDLSQIE